MFRHTGSSHVLIITQRFNAIFLYSLERDKPCRIFDESIVHFTMARLQAYCATLHNNIETLK